MAVFVFTAASFCAVPAGATPAAGESAGCSSGWGQLLPAGEQQKALEARGCAASANRPVTLADQMAIYDRPVTQGALGPLADPGARRARATEGPRASRARGRAQAAEPMRGGVFRPAAFAPLIDRAARAHDIDPLLLHAIARVESRHQPNAQSHAGAHGLMQVIVPTARRFGVGAAQELRDPETNLDVSARYLKTLQQRFGNDLPLVLAAYNAGEGAVEKYGRKIPPYRETQGYVRKVIAEYDLLRRVSAGRRSATVLSHAATESDL